MKMKMKMLAVFLLAVLGWSLTEGRNVSICELRDELKGAIGNLTVKANLKRPTADILVDNLVAKIVCHADTVSHLNTNADNPQESLAKEGHHSGEKRGYGRWWRHDKRPLPPTHPVQNCTLYGIFQLSSCQVCNNSVTPTKNTCGIPCSDLLDDNIQDDISCLLTIPSSRGDHHSAMQQLIGLPEMVKKEKCKHVQATPYFAGCP